MPSFWTSYWEDFRVSPVGRIESTELFLCFDTCVVQFCCGCCVKYLLFLSFSFFLGGLQLSSILIDHTGRAMTDTRKNRKQHARQEEDLDEATIVQSEVVSNNGEHDRAMVSMLRALMAEQHVADLEREERREKARKAEEERLEKARRLEEEKKLEAKKIEDERLEDLRVKRETEAREHVARLQKEAEDRQFQQQVQLLKLQREMGETAGKIHREAAAKDRKQDRALFNIACCGDEDDLEDYLMMLERRLETAGVSKEEWVDIVESKLRGRLAISWQDAVAGTGSYQEARDRILKSNGYTPRIAADKFFGWRVEQTGGLTVDQLYQMGQQLSRRMLAPGKLSEELEFNLVKGWLGTVIPRRARAAMDARPSESAAELIAVLQDHLALEGDGKSAIFKKRSAGDDFEKDRKEVVRNMPYQVTCYQCGKVGHKAADCWGGGTAPRSSGAPVAGSAPKIICHTCGIEGHKSPQCPRRGKGSSHSADAEPKPIRRVRVGQTSKNKVEGRVNGQKTQVLLDSGAGISIVPEEMVACSQFLDESVEIKPFGGTVMCLPMAETTFNIGGIKWTEDVAVFPMVEGGEREVLCSWDPRSEIGQKIMFVINKVEEEEVEYVVECNRVVVCDRRVVVKSVVPYGRAECNEPGTMEEQTEVLVKDVVLEEDEILDGLVDLFSEEEILVVEKEIVDVVLEEDEILDGLVDLFSEEEILVVEKEIVDVVLEEDEILDGLVDLFSEEEILVDLKIVDVVLEEDEILDGLVDLFSEEEILVDLKVDGVVLEEAEVLEGLVNLFAEEEIVLDLKDGKDSLCCLDENYDGFEKDSSDDVRIGKVETKDLGKWYKFKDECFDFEVWMEELKNELPGVVAAGLGRIGFSMPKIKGQLRACLGSVEFVWKFLVEFVWKFLVEFVWKFLVEFVWKFLVEFVWKFFVELAGKFIFMVAWKFIMEFAWKLVFMVAWKLVFMVVRKLVVESARRLMFEFNEISSLLTPATFTSDPSVVVRDSARLEAFNILKGMFCVFCVLTIPSAEDCFMFYAKKCQLRAAEVSRVGGDVGAEPPQMEGVATSGVALQEPGSVQGSRGSVQRL